jgi:hypothetical protein
MILFLFRKGERRRENDNILRVVKEELIDDTLFVQEMKRIMIVLFGCKYSINF